VHFRPSPPSPPPSIPSPPPPPPPPAPAPPPAPPRGRRPRPPAPPAGAGPPAPRRRPRPPPTDAHPPQPAATPHPPPAPPPARRAEQQLSEGFRTDVAVHGHRRTDLRAEALGQRDLPPTKRLVGSDHPGCGVHPAAGGGADADDRSRCGRDEVVHQQRGLAQR